MLGNLRDNSCATHTFRARLNQHSRGGFANAQLLVGVAILLVVGLLLQLQTCERLPFTAAKPGKAAASRGSGKAPDLIPPAPQQRKLAQAEDKFISQRVDEIARIDRMHRETIQSFARMDGRSAARVLAEMDQVVAVEILSKLRERDIARILEQADPEVAANWATALLGQPALAEVPEALQDAAARAGVYDNLPDLLDQAGIGNVETDSADSTSGAPNPDESQPGAETPGQTGPGTAEGTAAEPTAPGEASQAGQPPPDDGGATAAKPAVESLA